MRVDSTNEPFLKAKKHKIVTDSPTGGKKGRFRRNCDIDQPLKPIANLKLDAGTLGKPSILTNDTADEHILAAMRKESGLIPSSDGTRYDGGIIETNKSAHFQSENTQYVGACDSQPEK